MTIYRGQLKRIGDGTWKAGTTTSSVIEIGDRALRYIVYSDFMKTYLSDGLSHDTEIALSINYYNQIKVIKIGNRVYNEWTPAQEILVGAIMFLLGIPFLIVFLLGAVGIIFGAKLMLSGATWRADWAELRNS
jgi:hypothetical protein